MLGSDRSSGLLSICAQRGFDVFQDDVLTIGDTIRAESFDAVICIAVIHHLATEERRLEAIRSLVKVLTKGGVGLIYVWAFEQKKDGEPSKYLKKNENESVKKFEKESKSELMVHQNRTEFKKQDLFVPWKQANSGSKKKDQPVEVGTDLEQPESASTTKLRFYHVFRDGELQVLLEKVSNLIIVEQIYYDQGNWCGVFRKL